MSATAGAPITCKAVVATAAKAPLTVLDVIVAPPAAGEVRIRVVSSAVCHTDLYTLSGSDGEAVWPAILGHEAAGVVESIGAGVTSLAPGDFVVPLYTAECRECRFCVSKKTNLCSKVRATQGKGLMPDGTTRFTLAASGAPVFHYMGVSAFSEYTVCAEVSLAKVGVSPAASPNICLLGCGVTTGWGAATRTARVEAGATAAVFGLGAVGLACVLGLKECGAKAIIAVDVNPAKEALARRFGATHFVNPRELPEGTSVVARVQELTLEAGFGGVDYSFEAVGSVALMRAALECTVRGWGKSVIIGVAPAGAEIATRPFQLVTGRSWTGTAFGGVKGRSELPALVDRYAAGDFPLDAFVTHTFTGIAAVVDAVAVMENPALGALRPVIKY